MASIEKTLYFYRIIAEPSMRVHGSDINNRLSEVFRNIFSRGVSSYDLRFNKKTKTDVRFDVLEFTNHYIFGTYGKIDETNNPLVRVRETESNEIEPFKLPDGKALENFTFYFIDFKNRILCVLNNQQAGKLPAKLKEYAESKEEHIETPPLLVEDLKSILSFWHHFSKLEFSFSEEYLKKKKYKLPSELMAIDEEIGKYSCTLSFKKTNQITASTIADIPVDSFNYCKVYGSEIKDDETEQVSMDLIKKMFTRSFKIKISDDYEKNLREIKETLRDSITSIVNNCQ